MRRGLVLRARLGPVHSRLAVHPGRRGAGRAHRARRRRDARGGGGALARASSTRRRGRHGVNGRVVVHRRRDRRPRRGHRQRVRPRAFFTGTRSSRFCAPTAGGPSRWTSTWRVSGGRPDSVFIDLPVDDATLARRDRGGASRTARRGPRPSRTAPRRMVITRGSGPLSLDPDTAHAPAARHPGRASDAAAARGLPPGHRARALPPRDAPVDGRRPQAPRSPTTWPTCWRCARRAPAARRRRW